MDEKAMEDKIDELCKQVENLHSMMRKQPRQGLNQVNPQATSVERKVTTPRNVGWAKNRLVSSAVKRVIEHQNVARIPKCCRCAPTAIAFGRRRTLVSFDGATKRSIRKM